MPKEPQPKPTLLIVDDQPVNIQALSGLLKSDYRILVAASGKKALAIAGGEIQPDLILLDIMMPEMDGYEVCRRLKSDRRTAEVPVIFVTAKDSPEDEEKGLSLGAADYISTPYQPQIVRARVKTQTDRVQAEKAQRISEENFRTFFSIIPDPILILNSQGKIIEMNYGFEKKFGLKKSKIIGNLPDDLNISLSYDQITRIHTSQQSEKKGDCEEITLLDKNAFVFIAEIVVSEIFILKEPCLLVQIHDIDEIRRAQEAAMTANKKLSILSSITRHDILNQVMVISLYSDFLTETVSGEKELQQLQRIGTASRDIQHLIEFTRYYEDIGTKEPSWQQVDLLLSRPSIHGLFTGIQLTSELGPLTIYADRMLEKVLYNLIENSIRHGKDLSTITFSFHERDGIGFLWYEDDGGGVQIDEKERIFEKGFGKNTGMGLFLIREILSITGISIVETGTPGIGVRFEIIVPAGRWRRLA